MPILLYLLPFSYMLHSRIHRRREQAIVLFNEIVPNLLILYFLVFGDLLQTLRNWALCYAAFVSIYEIGYFVNDHVSARFEKSPQKRLPGLNPSPATIALWSAVRIGVHIAIALHMGFLRQPRWLVFYGVLWTYLGLHNFLFNRYFKVVTYMNLALLRFLAPCFMYLNREQIALVVPTVLLCHTFFRAVSYIDSKGGLSLPERRSNFSRFGYYLLLIGPASIFSLLSSSKTPLLLTLYYIAVVGIFYALAARTRSE